MHIIPQHPGGDVIRTPCVHFVPRHPGGHGFNLSRIDVTIPLGTKIHAFARHIALQCMAFEPAMNGIAGVLPATIASNHAWASILRSHAVGDIPFTTVAGRVDADLKAIPATGGPDNLAGGQWVKDNRWVRCTDLTPDGGGPLEYNGLDFLSLEILSRLSQAAP